MRPIEKLLLLENPSCEKAGLGFVTTKNSRKNKNYNGEDFLVSATPHGIVFQCRHVEISINKETARRLVFLLNRKCNQLEKIEEEYDRLISECDLRNEWA